MTTVGYGDHNPINSDVARLFTSVFALLGVAFVFGSLSIVLDVVRENSRKLASNAAKLAVAKAFDSKVLCHDPAHCPLAVFWLGEKEERREERKCPFGNPIPVCGLWLIMCVILLPDYTWRGAKRRRRHRCAKRDQVDAAVWAMCHPGPTSEALSEMSASAVVPLDGRCHVYRRYLCVSASFRWC
jgi:fatty acid desaturase